MGGNQLIEEQSPEQPREHPDGQEKFSPAGDPALAIKGYSATRHDHVRMGVMGQGKKDRKIDGGSKVLKSSGPSLPILLLRKSSDSPLKPLAKSANSQKPVAKVN